MKKNKKRKKKKISKKKNKYHKKKVFRKIKSYTKTKKRIKKIKRKIRIKKIKNYNSVSTKKSSRLLINIIRLQNKFKDNFTFNFKFDLFLLDKIIESFFQKIENKIYEYKRLKADENKRLKIEKLEIERTQKELIEIETYDLLNAITGKSSYDVKYESIIKKLSKLSTINNGKK